MSAKTRMFAALAALATCAMAWPSVALAQDLPDDEREKVSPLEEGGPIVRRKLLYRSTRVEVMPFIGGMVTDAFTHNGFVGANAAFHLTNEVSIGATGGFGLLHPKASLRESLEAELAGRGDRLANLEFSQIDWFVDVEGQFVPIFGKFNVMNGITLNYDIHLLGGVGFVSQSGVSAATGEVVPDSALGQATVAGVAGAGIRVFVGDMFAVTYDVRDYIFARTEVSSGVADPRITNNVMMSLGFSIFLPGQVKVSR